MKRETVILLGLAMFVLASTLSPAKAKPRWFQHLRGWQRILGVVAVILTLLIVLSPELMALGFLGDQAFFDMMVLALSLQMHMFAVQASRACVSALCKTGRWLGIPSPGLSYLLAVATLVIGSAVPAYQRATHRFRSFHDSR